MIRLFSIFVRIWVQRVQTFRDLIVTGKCSQNWVKKGWRIKSGPVLDNLAKVRTKAQDSIQPKVIGITCDNKMESFSILLTQYIESLRDVIKKKVFLPGVRFRVERATCYLLDLTFMADILWCQNTPDSFYTPGYLD